MSFESFDPLRHKSGAEPDVAALALKREIREILGSYVGWYDPFSELLQNALDSVEQRKKLEGDKYSPFIGLIIDIKNQLITVTDNGTGLTKKQFNQFLVPFYSFKTGKTRGHKGVGATYLAYGFNFIQVVTKSEDIAACGKMINARNWLSDENPAGNPEVVPDENGPIDKRFNDFDKGVSITIKIDSSTHPKDLGWIGTQSADSWLKILLIKTGLGAIYENKDILFSLDVIGENGKNDHIEIKGVKYFYVERFDNIRRSMRIRDLQAKLDDFYAKKGLQARIPSSLKNLDCVFEYWGSEELKKLTDFDKFEMDIVEKHTPTVYCGFAHSVKVFSDFNDSLGLRANYKVITGGFQIASNNMPQGEIYQIPLQRYIGRQNQIHFVFHFDNYNSDLGRKGYNKDITDFCKSIAEKLVTRFLNKYKPYLRASSGAPSDLVRKKRVDDWKAEMGEYEKLKPLILLNENFFLPTKKISITSEPTREQDVIALFNQLVAGGVIRGVKVMSTNERFTYDGLYHISIEEPSENHIYDKVNNPLGVLKEYILENELPFYSHPEILEYKYSLDGLIEDITDETKNSNEIGLVVVWEVGSLYKGNYHITSLLDEDNLSLRQYHGVTHIITNLTTDQKEMDLIVLSELISHLNNPDQSMEMQKKKYEEG